MSVVIETTIGDLTVDLFTDERPIACMNFIKLCKLKYYNYNLFHNIERDFIAQTGDPTGQGNGGSSIWGVIEGPSKRFFEAETLPKINHTSVGLLSLVSPGKNLVGSQFFFTLAPDLFSLDGKHCVIGEVVEGHDTLRALNEAIVDDNFRPYQDIRITHTVILDDPFPTMRGFREPSRSPSPSTARLQNGRIPADEEIDNTDGKSLEEIQEMLAEREAKARATILEIVGDLPDADMAPPENVLFVCKLNPVTTDDDLEIIFSRFGRVVSCEVIRDKQTGDSLQYAFVEFEDLKSCETAYFKMDNVLIDDRRIHVDFSQSVAKVKWRGKGRGIEGHTGRLDFNNLREKRQDKRRSNSLSRNGDREKALTLEERRKAREERHDNEQYYSRSRNLHKERPLTAEERRKAREERHREQSRHRTRSNSPIKEQTRRNENRRKSPIHQRQDRYRNNHREWQGRNREPQSRYKEFERERDNRYKEQQREREGKYKDSEYESFRERQRYTDKFYFSRDRRKDVIRNDREKSRSPIKCERDKHGKSKPSEEQLRKDKQIIYRDNKSYYDRTKQIKPRNSSSSSSTESSSTSSSSESSSESSSSSSSEEERRQKYKKKNKSHKNKSKKSKKHKK